MAKITTREKEDTRERIIEFSRKIFKKNGFEKTQLKMIAKEVGIAVSTLYGYYPSKIELFITSFVDTTFQYKFDFDSIEIELQNGLVDGIVSLLFTDTLEKMKNDRQIIRSFYIASISTLSYNEELRKRRNGENGLYNFLKKIIDVYDSKNKSLCAFSRVELIETIASIFESASIDYLLDLEKSEEEYKEIFKKRLRVLCAGKYECY
jgi:AcrR family transcriptional regulator